MFIVMKYQFLFSLFFILISNFQLLTAQVNAWEVQWDYDNTRYDGLLWQAQDDNWYMRVRYWYNGDINIIGERMELDYDENGIYLFGYSPYFIQSATGWETYLADNLFILTDGYNTRIFTVGPTGEVSEVTILRTFRTADQYRRIKRNRYGG